MSKRRDFTASFRDLHPATSDDRTAMYSYERPAYLFWNGMMNGLMDAGYTEAAAKQWLMSKAARWMLDGEMGDTLEKLAYEFGKSEAAQALASIKECKTWAKRK